MPRSWLTAECRSSTDHGYAVGSRRPDDQTSTRQVLEWEGLVKRTWSTVGRCGAAAGILGLVLAGGAPPRASPPDWWVGPAQGMIRGGGGRPTPSRELGPGSGKRRVRE